MPDKEKKETVQAEKYPLEDLLANSETLFGVKPETVRGALYGNRQTEFTVNELQKLIDTFLKRRVIN